MPDQVTGRFFLFCAFIVSVSSGCLRKEALQPLTNHAYVWQRHWSDALLTALNKSTPFVHGWRVLAAEADGRGDLVEFSIDLQALRRTARPVIPVIRIDGRGPVPLTDKFFDWKVKTFCVPAKSA